MYKYFKDKQGGTCRAEFVSIIYDGKVDVFLQTPWGYRCLTLKVYYRPERTWDDHMGNTPCGYYVNMPLPGGSKKRVYIY